MSTSKQNARGAGRTIAALSILSIGLAISARLIFGGPIFSDVAESGLAPPDQSTTLTSLDPSSPGKPVATQRPIASIRVGDRVFARNPEISDQERAAWQEPAWDDWLHLSLKMPLPSGDQVAEPAILDIEILRPEQWFVENVGLVLREREAMSRKHPMETTGVFHGFSDRVPFSPLRDSFRYLAQLKVVAGSVNADVIGLTIELDLPEMGAVGTAFVTEIRECPLIDPSVGQVVTATFAHPPTNQVLDVRFEGEADAIGVTDNHLFWSRDRQEFIAIGQMEIGERVVTVHGDTKRIESRLPRPGPELVYNLEVYGEHVYFVGRQGILVHNAYTRGTPSDADRVSPQGGYIRYGTLDDLGRPTGAQARITRDMIGTGTAANRNIQPPGFITGRHGANRARGHLLGSQLGGSGDEVRNLVTLEQYAANSPVMRDFETAIRQVVEQGQIVDYTMTPLYNFTGRIPRGVTLQAQGSGGFQLNVTVLNPPGM